MGHRTHGYGMGTRCQIVFPSENEATPAILAGERRRGFTVAQHVPAASETDWQARRSVRTGNIEIDVLAHETSLRRETRNCWRRRAIVVKVWVRYFRCLKAAEM